MEYLGKKRPDSIKHFHWDTDGITSTQYLSKSGDGIEMDVIYPSKPDLVLTMCPEMYEFIIKKGFACDIMHYAYSPLYHHPMKEPDEKRNYINLIGNSYSSFYRFHSEHYRYTSLKFYYNLFWNMVMLFIFMVTLTTGHSLKR